MKALRRKDRSWVLGLHTGGTVAATLAILSAGGFETFVVGSPRQEELFHTAWISGFVLGVVAACFDEVLGTREYLRQRAVSPRDLLLARLQCIGSVGLGWLVLAPLCAWLWFAVLDDGWQFSSLDSLGRLAVGFVPALSSAAIGFTAASLPASWWLRLGIAAAWWLAGVPLVDDLSRTPQLTHAVGWFVAGHVALAALALVVAFAAIGHDDDADRPWPQRLRWWALGPTVVGLGFVSAALLREPQAASLVGLHRLYPQVVRHGGRLDLARWEGDGSWRVVTGEHAATATVLARGGVHDDVRGSWRSPLQLSDQYEIEAPRWAQRVRRTAWGSLGTFYLSDDGAAWWRHWRSSVVRFGKGEANDRFETGASLAGLGDTIVVHEPAANRLWRLDPDRRHCVPLALPADDRIEQFDSRWLRPGQDDELRARLGISSGATSESVAFVRGAADSYVLRGGQLVAIPGLGGDRSTTASDEAVESVPADPITFSFASSPDAAAAPFRHEFTPRTALERVAAGGALACSLLRPPLLQGVAHLRPLERRPACWFDVLVLGGRRPWLVLAGGAVAALLAWGTARRLRRLGAPRPTIGFWSAATMLFGPAAAVFAFVCERPRAYADCALPGPFPAPRIVTVTRVEEPVA